MTIAICTLYEVFCCVCSLFRNQQNGKLQFARKLTFANDWSVDADSTLSDSFSNKRAHRRRHKPNVEIHLKSLQKKEIKNCAKRRETKTKTEREKREKDFNVMQLES